MDRTLAFRHDQTPQLVLLSIKLEPKFLLFSNAIPSIGGEDAIKHCNCWGPFVHKAPFFRLKDNEVLGMPCGLLKVF